MSTGLAQSFPVRYVQHHTAEMPRSEWARLTGLPEEKDAEFLVEGYKPILRKGLRRGVHKGDVWYPQPSEFDFPSKEQAALMDELAIQEASSLPIEISEVTESADQEQISATYDVVVSEEQLIEAEQGSPPGEEAQEPIKSAELPLGPLLVGGAIFGGLGAWIAPKQAKFVSAAVLGFLGGITTAVAAQKGIFRS